MTTLPTLPGSTPCRQVDHAEIDLSDSEYTLPGPFSAPSGSAETSADTTEERIAALRQALRPFAEAGEVYRQWGKNPIAVILIAETEDGTQSRILRVQDFLSAADSLRE